jgi:hypothetical protein
MLTIGFLSLCFCSYAQVKTDPKNTHQYPTVLPKGYYAIGNNAEKLGRPSSWGITTGASYPTVPKGYYATGNNKRRLEKQRVMAGDGKRSLPVITKGYYSIGRNNEKLKQ